jgi:membrane-bound lytic murein transglycosylase D
VDGIKTGFTKAARFCLVATSHRGGHRLVSIALGVRSPWVRNGIVANMMNEYYDAIRLGRLGESTIDLDGSKLFLDSVNNGLAVIKPNVGPKHIDKSDESYAYTYKTIKSKVKTYHHVRNGDNLSKIADRYNISLSDLKKWNKLRTTRVLKGQKLLVYKTVTKRIPVKLVVDPNEDCTEDCPDGLDTSSTAKPVLSQSKKNSSASKLVEKRASNDSVEGDTVNLIQSLNKMIYYTVQPGDTLWNIAQRYQSNVAEIKKANRITNGKFLKAGSRIKIPVNT